MNMSEQYPCAKDFFEAAVEANRQAPGSAYDEVRAYARTHDTAEFSSTGEITTVCHLGACAARVALGETRDNTSETEANDLVVSAPRCVLHAKTITAR